MWYHLGPDSQTLIDVSMPTILNLHFNINISLSSSLSAYKSRLHNAMMAGQAGTAT